MLSWTANNGRSAKTQIALSNGSLTANPDATPILGRTRSVFGKKMLAVSKAGALDADGASKVNQVFALRRSKYGC